MIWPCSVNKKLIKEMGNFIALEILDGAKRSYGQKRFISVIKKAYCEGIFKRRDRVNSAFSKSNSEIKMKYLPKEIAFFTDGYFDFDDGLWKSGGRNIRKV